MALDAQTPFSAEAAEEQAYEAREQVDQGGSRFPGQSYEEGVLAAIEWALGHTDDIPYPAE